MPEVGLILTDLSFKLVALNREVDAMLGYPERCNIKGLIISSVPEELVERIRHHDPAEPLCLVTTFRSSYFMDVYSEGATQPGIALLLESADSDNGDDAVCEVAAHFNLTDREQEALKWISQGLTSKEVAERMKISPNTVKAFLRLIMIKMNVTTRTGIMAKILEYKKGNEGEMPALTVVPDCAPESGVRNWPAKVSKTARAK